MSKSHLPEFFFQVKTLVLFIYRNLNVYSFFIEAPFFCIGRIHVYHLVGMVGVLVDLSGIVKVTDKLGTSSTEDNTQNHVTELISPRQTPTAAPV